MGCTLNKVTPLTRVLEKGNLDSSEWDELTNMATAPANSGSETVEQIKTARLGIIKSRTFPHNYRLNI